MARVSIGDRFGSLVVEDLLEGCRPSGRKKYVARCRCDCGQVVEVEKYNLPTGNTKRCAACARAARGLSKRTHGHSWNTAGKGTLEAKCYYTWQAMKRRCHDVSDKRYADYGGRGVGVCPQWAGSYETFLADMGLPPSRSHQIDRKDNDGDYCPGNCRWVSRVKNSRNKRNSAFITAFGESLTVAEWSERTGLKRETISRRIARGWSPEKSLSKHLRKPGASRAVISPIGRF